MVNHRFTRSAAFGLVLATLAAPAAFANIHDETVVVAHNGSAATAIRDETVLQRPQDTATLIRDETVVPASQSLPATSSSSSTSGDWTDRAIGAGGMLALIGLGFGGAYIATRHRRVHPRGSGKLTT